MAATGNSWSGMATAGNTPGTTKSTKTTSSGSSMGFSGGTLNGGNNNSGNNWGGSKNTGGNSGGNSGSSMGFSGGTLAGGNNNSGNNWGSGGNRGSNSGSSMGFSGGSLAGGNNYSGSNWGKPTSGGGGNVGGALSAGLGGNYSNPISLSNSAFTGYSHRFTPSLPGMDSPQRFDRTIYQSNLVNTYGTPMETWSNGYNPNKLTPGAQKIHQAIADASLRRNQPVDYFSGQRPYNPDTGTTQHSLGQAIDIRINDPVTGRPVGYSQIGEAAYNPIGSVRPGFRTPARASQIQGALAAPYGDFATDVIGSFYSNPGVYGPFQNQRWGGAFETGAFSRDYMHFDEGKAATGVSASQAALRQLAQNTAMPSGPLSDPSTSGPIQLAMTGMGNPASMASPPATSSPTTAAGLNAPYSNLLEKGDLQQVYRPPATPVSIANGVVGGYGVTALPNQPSYAVAGGQGILAVDNLNLRGPSIVPSSNAQVANVVPSWQQSTYSGPPTQVATRSLSPIDSVINVPDPVEPASFTPPQTTTAQAPIPYPVDTEGLGYKVWRGLTHVGDALLPGGGMMLRAMDDDLRQRWPSMTNEQRQALIDKWNANNNPGNLGSPSGNWVSGGPDSGGSGGGGNKGQYQEASNKPPAKPTQAPEKPQENTSWKKDALAYGFTAEQLKESQIAAYIKQLWDMGWIPKTATA